MKTHITHRFSATEKLVLVEYEEGRYDITYLTHEPSPEYPDAWFTNMSEDFFDWNTALRVFNLRRESKNPFERLSYYSFVEGKFIPPFDVKD